MRAPSDLLHVCKRRPLGLWFVLIGLCTMGCDDAPQGANQPVDMGGPDAQSTDATLTDAAPTDAAPDQALPCGGCGVGAVCVADTCEAAPPPPPAPGAAPVDTTLCFSEHAIPGGDDPTAIARQAALFDVLARMGVRTLRQQFQWHRIEPSQGTFDWRSADGPIGVAHAYGIETMALLGYGNPWASALGAEHNDPYYPADDPADFAAFSSAFATRFGDRITRYEIWNEQNAGYRFWKHPDGPDGQPGPYAATLRASYDAIHAVQPDALVGFGGMFYVPQAIIGAEAFLADTYAADPEIGDAFDALAWHPYAFYPPLDPPERDDNRGAFELFSVDQTAQRLVQIMVDHEGEAARAKPRWITELGWPSERGIDEATQAQYLVRGWLLALAGGVDTYCIYRLEAPSPDRPTLTPWEPSFGVVHHDPDPTDGQPPVEKPAVAALAGLNDGLAGLRYARRLDPDPRLPPDVHWLVFSDEHGETADVIWSHGEPSEVPVALRGPATVRHVGEPPMPVAGPIVRLTIDGTPHIIRQAP
jgi:hypothetical protein